MEDVQMSHQQSQLITFISNVYFGAVKWKAVEDGWRFDLHPQFFFHKNTFSLSFFSYCSRALVMRVQRALKGGGSRLLIYLIILPFWKFNRFWREHASVSFVRWRLPLESFRLTCNWTPLCSWVRRCCLLPASFPSIFVAARSLWVDAFHNQRNIIYLRKIQKIPSGCTLDVKWLK